MFHKITSVIAKESFTLIVSFAEGVTKRYDAKKLIEQMPAFSYFRSHPDEFNDVSVDIGGYGIIWNDDLDLACDELWENGATIRTRFDGLIALSEATYAWGLSESALRKAIARSRLTPGIDVNKFGKQWVVSAEAMRREYGEPRAE